jgi:hypothetical protein
MATKKSLKDSLKRTRQRLPHGYELVARKKKTVKRKATRKSAPKKKSSPRRKARGLSSKWSG